MIFSEKLQILRKNRGFTQEELAEKLQVSRQAVAKWESGISYPDILNLVAISELFRITVDYLVKDNDCTKALGEKETLDADLEEMIAFRLRANQNTYAGFSGQCDSSRLASHDYSYEEDGYLYYDTYLGGEQFMGEEAVWKNKKPLYAMNYSGRVLDERFSGNFLKEALRAADRTLPFRGPAFYQAGEYIYQTKVIGDVNWFQGYEEIYYQNDKVYECYYHGGILKQ